MYSYSCEVSMPLINWNTGELPTGPPLSSALHKTKNKIVTILQISKIRNLCTGNQVLWVSFELFVTYAIEASI